MERVLIYAKPSATDVNPYIVSVLLSPISTAQIKEITIMGKSFFQLRNLYVSGSDPSIFENLNYTYYNPFSSILNLSATNPGFYAYVVPSFYVVDDKIAIFSIPDQIFYSIGEKTPPYSAYLDIIIENEAGYGLLSRDSHTYRVSSWRGFTDDQLPSISGIYITTS